MSDIVKDISAFASHFEKTVKKDLQNSLYAAQQALNNTAFGASDELWKRFNKEFTVRNRQLKRGLWIKKANKNDGLDMQVDISFQHDWMKMQAFGWEKKPKDTKRGQEHKMLAIPTSNGKVKINKSGRITGAGATRMLAYSLKNPKAKKRHVARPHAFIMRGVAGGKDVIAMRDKFNRKHIDFYYLLIPSLKIKKNWPFYDIIQEYFQKNLATNFDKAFEWAMNHPKK